MRLTFTDEPLEQIIRALQGALETLAPGSVVQVSVLDPDLGPGLYAGEAHVIAGVRYRHRPLQSWLDLAERLGCRLHTPQREGVFMTLGFSRLEASSWHAERASGTEAYGSDSDFSRIKKLEEPTFWLDYTEALTRAGLRAGDRVLSLGIGRGDELLPFSSVYPDTPLTFTGVDHAASALAVARERFPEDSHTFVEADLGALGALELGTFELVLSLATFQSPGVQGHTLVREVVQRHISKRSSLILALPNCRYQGGTVLFGARLKNFARPDLSLLVKDLAFYRKYLQQHGFRVALTGKYYLFLTAVRG